MKKNDQTLKPDWTILKLIQWTTAYFSSHKIENPRVDAEILLAYCLGIKRVDLYIRFDQPLSQNELAVFKDLIKRRAKREPVAYITGRKEFWSIDFTVTPDVLIPRPDTECLVETALSLLPDSVSNRRILELGVGSGAVSVALATERPDNIFFASDYSFHAAALARQNARQNKVKDLIQFFCGDWLSSVRPDRFLFDMILSNPPYIPSDEIKSLQPEIVLFEPLSALDGDEDGLAAIRTIINTAHCILKPSAPLLLEIGYNQKSRVVEIISQTQQYQDVTFYKDYAGHDRLVIAENPARE